MGWFRCCFRCEYKLSDLPAELGEGVRVACYSYDALPDTLSRSCLEGITNLVEHPIQLKPPGMLLSLLLSTRQ